MPRGNCVVLNVIFWSDWLEFLRYSLDLKCLIPLIILLLVILNVVDKDKVFLIVFDDS